MLSIEPVDRLSSDEDRWPLLEQRFGEVRSDETGAAGNQRSHA